MHSVGVNAPAQVLVTVSGWYLDSEGHRRLLEHGERTHDAAQVWRLDGGPWRLVSARTGRAKRGIRPRLGIASALLA